MKLTMNLDFQSRTSIVLMTAELLMVAAAKCESQVNINGFI